MNDIAELKVNWKVRLTGNCPKKFELKLKPISKSLRLPTDSISNERCPGFVTGPFAVRSSVVRSQLWPHLWPSAVSVCHARRPHTAADVCHCHDVLPGSGGVRTASPGCDDGCRDVPVPSVAALNSAPSGGAAAVTELWSPRRPCGHQGQPPPRGPAGRECRSWSPAGLQQVSRHGRRAVRRPRRGYASGTALYGLGSTWIPRDEGARAFVRYSSVEVEHGIPVTGGIL